MYSVIVIDDEPTALNHICTIIRMKCPEFTIIATAENGQEGIEKICSYEPDVVITDIKMPIMNGIEMVKKLHAMKNETYVIIISGYQEFEYAQSALKSGVVDYLLKPIIPIDIKEVLGRMQLKLQNRAFQKRNQLIRSLFLGDKVGEWELKKHFPSTYYYGAIVRRNGLPKRFSDTEAIEIFSFEEDIMFTYGRDEMEALYLCPKEALNYQEFEKLIEHEIDKVKDTVGYITTAIYKEAFEPQCITDVVKKLYRILDSNTAIGYSQILTIGEEELEDKIYKIDENKFMEQIEYHMKKNQRDKVWIDIMEFLRECDRVHYPQLLLEGIARKILYSIQKYDKSTDRHYTDEFMLEDAFYYATNGNDLLESLQDIYNKYLRRGQDIVTKVDTPEFLQNIKMYIEANIVEDLSLSSICKNFGVSQTSLSKLFRKYEGDSFNNYLTTRRIEKAKELFKNNEGILIKDVAALVGYKDQFYFSRIFRSIVGVCPSDYTEK
ncbi:response regulator transcription factor [Sporanaerobium hydrogeniformans]|uniref:response regulator transcription factor n=1 Tax=Sporanaerobium hydrogeniformans TaxID=3072179 RepID=UPI0015D51F6A|nr:response regulator [Sporanaerobium hydrogeniformans]